MFKDIKTEADQKRPLALHILSELTMGLRAKLKAFASQIALATTDAPDEYLLSKYGYEGLYEAHMADLKSLWSEIKPQLHDIERAMSIDAMLHEMVAAFDAGDKATGRTAAWALYNAETEKLK